MLLKGFKFGMLLQLAIGPVSLFIFDTACKKGLVSAAAGTIAVTLVDALFVFVASLGSVASFRGVAFLEKRQTQLILKLFGAVVLILFGLSAIVEVWGWRIFPEFKLVQENSSQSTFIQGLIITASSPLTILFWAGVFSTKIAEENYHPRDLFLFGTGAVLATLFFQTLISLAGTIVKHFLPPMIINLLNIGVGISLIYFALRLVKSRQGDSKPLKESL